jgi:hypothetical protein
MPIFDAAAADRYFACRIIDAAADTAAILRAARCFISLYFAPIYRFFIFDILIYDR